MREEFFGEFLELDNLSLKILNKSEFARILHTSPAQYRAALKYFEEKCTNMLEFLRWYNLLDCHLLTESIKKYSAGFLDNWGTNIHEFKSVSFSLLD